MAVAFDTSYTIAESASASSISVANVAPTGSDRLLMAFTGNDGPGDPPATVSSITKGATSITDSITDTVNAPYWRHVARYLKAPSTTSESVTVTYSSTMGCWLGVMTFNGVDQTTPVDAAEITNVDNFNPTADTVSSAVGDMVASAISCGWHTGLTHQGDGTERQNAGGIGSYLNAAMATAAGAASVSVEWGGGSGYNTACVMVGININASAGAAANPKGPLGGLALRGPLGGPPG